MEGGNEEQLEEEHKTVKKSVAYAPVMKKSQVWKYHHMYSIYLLLNIFTVLYYTVCLFTAFVAKKSND